MLVASACAHVEAPRPASPTTHQLVTRALPSVVLVVGDRPDGKVSFGSGIVVGANGSVLTCLHLVRGLTNLRGMLYAPELVSYTPMDGGLDRFLFENRHRLSELTIDRIDEANDLALVHLDADTSKVPLLSLANALPQRGEVVLALGHPRETVWSFSSGVISALHHGAIQHDAAVNPGSSGGPLINEKGEIVGITSAKVFGETDGVGFARPIGIAKWLLEDQTLPFELELTTPEKAASSCIRAQELASPHLEECFDWEHRWRSLGRVQLSLAPHVEAQTLAALVGSNRGEWIEKSKTRLREAVRAGKPSSADVVALPPLPAALHPLVREARALLTSQAARLKSENHLVIAIDDQRAVRTLLRRGVRVEATLRVKPHLAWVSLVGRNPDGTEYRFSEAWAQDSAGQWHQRTPAGEQELSSLPKAFAPPLVLEGEMIARVQLELLGRIYALTTHAERSETSPTTDASHCGRSGHGC